MERYKRAFDGIQVPEDMARRVREGRRAPQRSRLPRWSAAAACLAVAVALGGWGLTQGISSPAPVPTPTTGVSVGNPVQPAENLDALQKAVGGQLVTNQIEWNPVCFEHFNSGMMDYLAANRIHPMIWSPLAGGRLFKGDDEQCAKAMAVIKTIADKYGVEPAVIVYAWIMYHPVQAMPLVGSSKLDRLDLAIKALDVKLEHYEWYQIYVASGQQVLR